MGAIRAVDELNHDWRETSRASDTEPAPPPSEPSDEEVTKPDAHVCNCACPSETPGEHKNKCSSIGAIGSAWQTAPAGIVRIPGEELFEAIESEEDIVNANRELLEGTPQTTEQTEQWRRLYGEIMNEANKRLRGRGVMLLVAVPNPNGLGCVFTGLDLPRFETAQKTGLFLPGGEDYEVILTLPAAERVDLRKAGREEFVRRFIGIVCDAVLEQKAVYDRRALA